MTDERQRYIRGLSSIVPLAEHTDLLSVKDEKLSIEDRLEAPVDEYGIPRANIMIERLLGSMITQNFVWSGKYDLHHLATPKADYTIVRGRYDGDVGSAYRGISSLKIELPRQMHNYAHAVFKLPRPPHIEVMRQALLEVGQLLQLKETFDEQLGRKDRLH